MRLLLPLASAPLHEWKALLEIVHIAVEGDPFWESRLADPETFGNGLHLAVLNEPYLGFILDGRKTVESRFAMRRVPPYQRVYPTDVLLLKRAAGPIVGLCQVTDTWFYSLTNDSWNTIRQVFAQSLCADWPDFWASRQKARFVTLMRIGQVRAVGPIACDKRDRRGWVVIRAGDPELLPR